MRNNYSQSYLVNDLINMILLVFIILFSLGVRINSGLDCDLSNEFEEKIKSSDLIIVGRILNQENNEIVVAVIKILKGFELINDVKKISHNNDYHLILVRKIKYIKDCKMLTKLKEDFLFYLTKTTVLNFFELKFAKEFDDGSFEKRISAFINGDSSRFVQNHDPCSKLDCKFGAQCQKWPGNPPTAVCHCSKTSCPAGLKDTQICGSDGIFYETECHMRQQECILQRSIAVSLAYICDNSRSAVETEKNEVQQDEIIQSISQFCKHQKCPSYATCISHPYPHCKCPTDKCTPDSPMICGTDEITYTNICELRIVSCKANRFIGKQYEGRCDMCKFFKCEFNGVCEMTEDGSGTRCKCLDPDEACSKVDSVPVCGSDDVTYQSECHLKIESCRKKLLISVNHKEACKTKVQKDLITDLCLNIQCMYGSKCVQNSNSALKCSCTHIECDSNNHNPVCGNDGETYTNKCFLEKAMCESQRSIQIINQGQCDQNPCVGVKCNDPYQYCRVDVNEKGRCICPEPCPQVVQPVCGSDNGTYESICHLTRTSCITQKYLWVIHNGVCSEEPRCQEQGYDCSNYQICKSDIKQTRCECPTCPESGIGEYVCGTDGKTYRSECHLRNTACTTNSMSLKVANIGACDACQKKKCLYYSICRMNRFGDPQCICPTDCVYVRKPVCGSDGRTYDNDCFLKVKSCAENRPISIVSPGICKTCSQTCPIGQMCRLGTCVCIDKCTQLKLRVCGSDGNYYESECELKRQACIQKKTIRIDISEASCISRQYISDETGPNNYKLNKYTSNTKSCMCNKKGSSTIDCDSYAIKCTCKPGVGGQYCDKCIDGYWNFTEFGCTACSCNKFGSESIQCHTETGKCQCKHLVLGKYCSVCPPGFLMSNNGCKESSLNENKIDAVELSFSKDSFAKSYWTGNADKYLSINISFVPLSPNGIIFYHSDPLISHDFLTLVLKDKYVEYRLDLGSGLLLLKSSSQLVLGRSHSILVERFNRHARLIVNNKDSKYGITPPFLTSLDAGVGFVIGLTPGLKTNTLYQTNHLTESFVGCLSSLKIISGEETNEYLMNQQDSWISESSNVKPNCPHVDFNVIEESETDENLGKENSEVKDYCELHKPCLNGGFCQNLPDETYNCQCQPGFQGYTCGDIVSHIWKFKENSFIIIPSESLQLRQKLKLNINFLPTSGNGILFFISDGHYRNPAFLSVILNRNHVEVTCRTPIGVTKLTSVESIIISKWNQVEILKTAKYVYLKLNLSPKPIKKLLIPKGFANVDSFVRRKLTQFRITNQPMFFGGVDGNIYNSFSNVVSLRPNFQGAIQKISVNGENIRFQNSDIIFQNITQWQGPPCGPLYNPCSKMDPEKNYCIAEMNKSICFCSPKQEHLCKINAMQHDFPTNTNFNRKFLGESCAKYMAVKHKRVKSTTKNNIRLKFKTEASDGMLLLIKKAYNAKKHFMVVGIRNQVIEVAVNLGGNNGTIRIESKKIISDNKWHTIQIIRNNRNIVLLVDNRMFRAKMLDDPQHNILESDGWMWLGGPKKPIVGFPWEYNNFFKGCIAELYVDEVAFNLINDSQKNIGPVLKC